MTGKDYKRAIERERQARKRRTDAALQVHKCPKCGKVFDRKEYLERHIRNEVTE